MTRNQMKIRAFGHFDAGLKPSASRMKLIEVNPGNKLSITQSHAWFNQWKTGVQQLKHKQRPGRPRTVITKSNIGRIRTLIEADRSISLKVLSNVTGIDQKAVWKIIKFHLKMRKVGPNLIPHDFTPLQKTTRVNYCLQNLAEFKNGSRLRQIVNRVWTGDETWVNFETVSQKNNVSGYTVMKIIRND